MKTNKNGVKLLAAIMALAMVVVGGAVIINSDDAYAATGDFTPIDYNEVSATLPEAGGNFIVTSEKTITVGSAGTTNLYVADGVSVTINSKDSSAAVVNIFAASSDGKYSIENDSNVTITSLQEGSITVKVSYSGSSTVGSSITLSGTPKATINVSAGSLTGGDVSVGSDGLVLKGTDISGLSIGSKLVKSTEAGVIYYIAPGANQSFTLNSEDTVSIYNGTYTVSNNDNTIRFSKYQASNVANPVVVTGATSPTYPSISGGLVGDSKGSISIITGKFIDSSFLSAVFNGASDGTNLINQIPNVAGGYTVKGTLTQNVALNVSGITITVPSGTLIVPENVVIDVNTVKDYTGSVIKVFGTLESTTYTDKEGSTNHGNVFVGAYGSVLLQSTKAGGNTNVTSGPDTGRSGEISGTITDAVLTAEATIPSGQTLIVTGNLGLNGQTLNVKGKLIIEAGASIYTTGNSGLTYEKIVLASTGSIQNNGYLGTIEAIIVGNGTDTIKLEGVTGAQFGFAAPSMSTTKKISIYGDITTSGFVKEAGNEIGKITLTNNVIIGDDTTIGTKVTLAADSATNVAAGKALTINGKLTGTIVLGFDSSVQIEGEMAAAATIEAYEGPIDGAGKTTRHNVTVGITVAGATGFTVYSKTVTTDDGKEVQVYIQGIIEKISGGDAPTATLTNNIHISAEGLTLEKGTVLTTTNAVVYLDGVLKQEGTTLSIDSANYIGATYSVKVDDVTTTYYTDLATAIGNIEIAKDKTVNAVVNDIDSNITIAAGQKLVITINGEVKKGASITFEKDSKATMTVKPNAELTGSIVVYKGVNCIPGFTKIDATIVSDDKTVYAGFVTAIDMASAGDTLTVGNVQSDESLIIKDGITLVADSLTVKGNLTVPETSTLKAGSITMVSPATNIDAKVNVLGTLDLSAGSITGDYELKSTGKTILASINSIRMSGAYYTTSNGFILTTLTNAVEGATAGEIVIIGKISEKTDITLEGINLRISSATGTEVTLGTITLDGAKVIAENKLTATIISVAETTTTGAADASVAITGATITVQDIETGLQINNVAGKVNVLSGIVTIAGAATIATDSELAVAEGAQALVTGSLTTSTGKITVNGELAVKGTLSVSTIIPAVNGTITAQAGSMVTIDGAKVAGMIVAEETSSFSINDSGVSVLDGAKVAGEFTLTADKYVKAFAGADVEDMDLGATVYSTAYYVNGDLIETIYAINGIAIPDVSADLGKIPELNVPATIAWKDANGSAVTIGTDTVDSNSAVYATIALKTADVKVSIGTGISLWIDGIKQITADTAELTIGEHQVQVTINPGYKGTATIAFNGAAVSNGKIDITADMVGATNVISATGDITIDSGDTPVTPVEPEKKDDGMGITDYLLIVLVVLAAILVVIVAIRMMRS